MTLCLNVNPHMATVWNSLWIITKHKTGWNPTQDELKTSFVTVSWLKCSMQNIISLSTWSQITGLNLKCIVNYVVFGLKRLSSSAQRLTVCCAFRFCKSLCCKPTVFVYTGCSIKCWVSHLFSFLNHSCQFVLSTLVCLKSWVREDVEKEGSSETDRKQDRAVTNEDSCQLGWRGSDVKQETTGVESGISNNRKLLHTDSDMQASETLFERWWQPDTFRSAALC